MSGSTRVHLTFGLKESDVPAIAAARREWDPVMASGVPPHVTLVYPEEFGGNEDLLVERAEQIASEVGPFTMKTEALVSHGEGDSRAVMASASEPTGSWTALRRDMLKPPFEPLDGAPHVTLVHPRTSRRGSQAWAELAEADDMAAVFVVREFCLTSTNQVTGMIVRQHFPLLGEARQVCAAVILVEDDRGLLARRTDDRQWHPGVWDFVGGRVEAAESLPEAACREVHEELGVMVEPERLKHVETLVTDDAEVVVFATSRWNGTPRNAAPNEHSEIRWCDSQSLEGLTVSHPQLGDVMGRACALRFA